MAPSNIHPNLNQHRRSKAQTCLFKILHIISVFPTGDTDDKQCLTISEENCENGDLNVDLNIELRHPKETEPSEPPEMAEHGGDGENCSSEDLNSEISDIVYRNRTRRDEGYLGLLTEAAQLILGGHESPAPVRIVVESAAAEIGHGTKRKPEIWTAEWWPEFKGTLPALKSKRGRNLVLPEKFKDSSVVQRSKGRSKW